MALSIKFLALMLPKFISTIILRIYQAKNAEQNVDTPPPNELQIQSIATTWPIYLNHAVILFLCMLFIKDFNICKRLKPASMKTQVPQIERDKQEKQNRAFEMHSSDATTSTSNDSSSAV